MMDEGGHISDFGLRLLLVGIFAAAIIGGAVDLILDAPDTWWSPHVIYEVVVISASMVGFYLLWRNWLRTRHDLTATRHELAEQTVERDAWRASAESAIAGFGGAIDERFRAWHLTPAESEVALLLLKGRSHKEIAYLSNRSERTVRQHAVSVYQKSRLAGRAELAAFFLDAVSLPSVPVPAHAGSSNKTAD
jgi:DNA-binding CsgD family transcriptional regulator